jgi:SAM-dependent MidA family methyltransferase
MSPRPPLSTLPVLLPALTAGEAAHAARVEGLIRRHIAAAGGWIDFETFMDLALYAPGLGYYSAGSVKLGAAGDFVTAPEVSALYARCVARQCGQVLEQLGGGSILEFGAGTGALAAEVLRTLAARDALPARYDILEVSADLRQRQQERLRELPPRLLQRVHWLSALPDTPLTGVIIANEVLDALPCQRFVVRGGGVRALGVALAADAGVAPGAGAFVLREAEPGPALRAAWQALQPALAEPLLEGYTSEVCLRVAPWIASVGALLARGAVLLFDYGLPRSQYYHAQRHAGTLVCHFKHRAHADVLLHPGVQDVTAWVDFTRVAEAAEECALEVLGFATQAAFLLGAGIGEELAGARTELEHARLAGEAQRLLLPGEMGEAFKLLALGRGLAQPLAAFAHQDLRDSL